MNTYLVAALSAPLIAATATAAAAEPVRFERDGKTFNYTVVETGRHQIIKGSDSAGANFRLVVRDGKVSGRYGETWVSYPVTGAGAATRLVAR